MNFVKQIVARLAELFEKSRDSFPLAVRKGLGQESKMRPLRPIYSWRHLFIFYTVDFTPFLKGGCCHFFWVGVALICEQTQGGN